MAIDRDRTIRLIAEVWSTAIHQVLSQVPGSSIEIAPGDRNEEREAARQGWKDAAWICFDATGSLTGGHGFAVPFTDVASLVKLFNGDIVDDLKTASPERADVLAELFRQVESHAIRTLEKEVGSEISFVFQGQKDSAWEPREFQLFRVKHSNEIRASISLVLSEEFIRNLDKKLGSSVEREKPSGKSAFNSWKFQSGRIPEKVGLFLDIELEATLRFGTREMPICDVLELGTGSVVELNKMVDEPVELLVCGKVIARGDVVVVDGNHALRIREILSHSERICSLAL